MTSSRTGDRTRHLASAALIAALMAATSWLTAQLPTTVVPVTPQMFFVVLAGLLLPPRWAAGSMATYVALGAVGMPVFSGGKGGVSVLVGPTGGYLIGFIVAAFVASVVRIALEGRMRQVAADGIASVAAVIVAYTIGTTQLALVLNLSSAQAIAAGVAPFIVFDVVKAAVAVAVVPAIRRARG